MPEIVNQKIDVFLGLNNMLHPASPEYREGMAYRSKCARIGEDGVWGAQQALTAVSGVSTTDAPHGSGGHYKFLAVDDTSYVVTMTVDVSCDVGPNKKLYSTDGSTLKCARETISTAYTPPDWSAGSKVLANTTGVTGRMQDGTYFYMCTYYDTTYKRESLPSEACAVDFDSAGTSHTNVTITYPTATDTKRVRIYRTKRTSSADGVYNPTNIFYFVAEKTSGTTHTDYLHDREISNYEYEGRGTDPYTAMGGAPDYLVSFNNRMLYFKGNTVYWSSAGRPEEVAAEYTVEFDTADAGSQDYSATCKPKLSIGAYGEAHFEIMELSGHTVKAAMPLFGKLYVWTDSLMGYLDPTNRLEGYRFKLLRAGVGVTSDKVLALSPYGLFGADRQGIWLLTPGGIVRRLTDNTVDLHAGTDTTYTQTNFTNSFGCWSPATQEYLWGISGQVLAYQANRGTFAGPYDYAVTGGCAISTTSGHLAYLKGYTPDVTTKDTTKAQYLEFWMGQSTPTTIKDQLAVEVVFAQNPSGEITAEVIQNCIAHQTEPGTPTSTTVTHGGGSDEPILCVNCTGSGRYFLLKLSHSVSAPIATVNYRFNAIPWSDNYGR